MTETFPIVPGHPRMLWLILPVFLVLAGAGVFLFLSFRGARTARFEVSSLGLRVRGDVYGRLIPADALRLEAARAVNLRLDTELAPVARTFGTALPGYRSGWFRLRDGEKALLFVTDSTRVAYVPTTEGFAVMVSVEDPAAFLATLRRHAGRP